MRLRAKAYGQILARAMTVGRLLEAMDFSRSSHAMNCTCSTSFCSRHNAAYIRLWGGGGKEKSESRQGEQVKEYTIPAGTHMMETSACVKNSLF